MKQYKCTAEPWALVKYEGVKPVIIRRCRTFSDADGYRQVFEQLLEQPLTVVFDAVASIKLRLILRNMLTQIDLVTQ